METQSELRKLADKKLLNAEQKKTLYKLFESRIDKEKQAKQIELDNGLKELKKKTLENAKRTPKIAKLIKLVIESNKALTKAEKEVEAEGFTIRTGHESCRSNNIGELDLKTYYSYGSPVRDNKEISAYEKKMEKTLTKIDELKLQVLADLQGLPMTYTELKDYVEAEIARISKL
jgi:hypothetical protein